MFGKFIKVAKHLPNNFTIVLNKMQFYSTIRYLLKTLETIEFVRVEVCFYSVLWGCKNLSN